MKIKTQAPLRVLLFSFILIFQFSCSKDSDLLTDYVLADAKEDLVIGQYVVDDNFETVIDDTIVLDVLANDDFENTEEVAITETTAPVNGTVEINTDNTLTYIPDPEIVEQIQDTTNVSTPEVVDTFTYTTEVVNEDETVSTETGNVTVTASRQEPIVVSVNVAKFKADFDAQTIDDARQIALSNSGVVGDLYYFDVSPYVYMFQVTGQDSYMDFAMELFQNTINTSTLSSTMYSTYTGYSGYYNDSYYSWGCPPGGDPNEVTTQCRVISSGEVVLNETRGMRTVARMLWVLSKSPTYLAKGTNQAKYDSQLAWFERNIWEKWMSRGIGWHYRSHTHMSSHSASIAWFLHQITQKQEYRDFYDNWSYAGYPATSSYSGANMRDNLREISLTGGNGYVWNGAWGSLTGSNDVSHANAEVETMVLGAEMNDYWTTTDMQKLIRTFNQIIFKNSTYQNQAYYITGGGTAAALWDQGWVQLGRFSETLQTRLENAEILPTYYYYQKIRIANLAYNRAYLDGTLYYPEN